MFNLPFQVQKSSWDEELEDGESPEAYVQRTAAAKARSLGNVDSPLLSADTTVAFQGQVVGKPVDEADACRILDALRDRQHQVITAVVLSLPDGRLLQSSCLTNVQMRDYGDEEVANYVASGDPMDKAGAYAIQHKGFHPVERIDGCQANVMGLPLCHTALLLKEAGLADTDTIARNCQSHLGIACPVYSKILKEA